VANPKLALVILAVRDLPAMTAFYKQLLGWKQVVDVPVYVELQADDGMRFGLYADDHFALNIGVLPAATTGEHAVALGSRPQESAPAASARTR